MKRKHTPYVDVRHRQIRKDGFVYTYTLLATEEVCPIYSIRIDLLCPDREKTTLTLAQPIYDGGRAAVLFDLLSEHLVTPIDLPYVMEDLLDL